MLIDDATQAARIDPKDIKSQMTFAAKKLEEIFINELLKSMRETHLYDDYPGNGFESQVFWSMWDSEIAQRASQQESLGLAPVIYHWLEQQLKVEPAATNPSNVEKPSSHSGSAPIPKNISTKLSSNFGWRTHPIFGHLQFHAGIDLALPKGYQVNSPVAGTVEFAGNMKGYGNTVILRVDDGHQILLAHLDSMSVTAGTKIELGSAIGTVGETGNSTGPHLHLEVRDKGEAINPLSDSGLVSSIDKVLLKAEETKG